MLKEGLEYFQGIIKRESGVEIIDLEDHGEPEGTYAIHNHSTGETQIHKADPPRRTHALKSLGSFCDFLLTGRDAARDPFAAAHVWHCEKIVSGLLDCETRHESVTVTLARSTAFWVLENIANRGEGTVSEHPTLMRMLRVQLDGYVPQQSVDTLANLKMSRDDSSHVAASRMSVSREAAAMTMAEGNALPPEIIVTCPVYDEAIIPDAKAHRIRVLLSYAGDGKFTVDPVARDMSVAKREAEQEVGDRLKKLLAEAKIPVFHGTP